MLWCVAQIDLRHDLVLSLDGGNYHGIWLLRSWLDEHTGSRLARVLVNLIVCWEGNDRYLTASATVADFVEMTDGNCCNHDYNDDLISLGSEVC